MMKQQADIDNKNFFSEADVLNILDSQLISLMNEKIKNPEPFQDEICKAIVTYDFQKLKTIIQHKTLYKKHVLFAIALRNTLGLQVLLEAGADPNEPIDNDQTTPLLYAIEIRYFEGVRLLLQYSRTDHLSHEVLKMLTRKIFSEKKAASTLQHTPIQPN